VLPTINLALKREIHLSNQLLNLALKNLLFLLVAELHVGI
jgi:hypothetical protein